MRNAVAVLERPYLGWLKVTGADHADLLHRLTCNELRNLRPGDGQINIFPNEIGRIVDRVCLLKFNDSIVLIPSAGNVAILAEWIKKYVFIEDVTVTDLANEFGVLTLIGPRATELLRKILSIEPTELEKWHFQPAHWRDDEVIVHRSGELLMPAFNLIIKQSGLGALWDTIFAEGVEFDVSPVGETALNILRIEAGWPIHGIDFDQQFNPHEAGMAPYINLNKGCYIGQEVIARLDTYDKIQKRLVGLVLQGKELPALKDKIFINGNEAGFVTSAVYSPGLKKGIALAYIQTRHFQESAAVCVDTKAGEINGELVKLPFVV